MQQLSSPNTCRIDKVVEFVCDNMDAIGEQLVSSALGDIDKTARLIGGLVGKDTDKADKMIRLLKIGFNCN